MFSERFKTYLKITLIGVLFILSLVNLYSSTKQPSRLTIFEKIIMVASAPLQAAVTWVIEGAGNTINNYLFLVNVRQQNEELKAQIAKLRSALDRQAELELENQRLRALLNYTESNPQLAMVTARIVGIGGSSTYFKTIRINRGTADGVGRNMPVVTSEGLVGRVTKASARWADVLLITDPDSAVDVLVQRTRARGIVKGKADEDALEIEYLMRTEEVAPGDAVVSSGVGGLYPHGLKVGEVSSVNKDTGTLFQAVSVAPSVQFSRLEEVMVLSTPPQKPQSPDSSSGAQ